MKQRLYRTAILRDTRQVVAVSYIITHDGTDLYKVTTQDGVQLGAMPSSLLKDFVL